MSADPSVRAGAVGTDTRFALFAVMWALANCIHLANQFAGRIDNPAAWANLVAAVLVLLRPRSVHRLVLLAALQLLEVVSVSPLAADHAMLAAGVNMAILLCALRERRRGELHAVDADAFLDRVAVPARLILLIGYTAAAVAKYNSNFFDPIHSCASYLADIASLGVAGSFPALGPVHVAVSVVAETLIPVLLVVPATRRVGARVGIVIHFLVSLSPVMHVGDFSATLWPLFLLFLPAREFEVVAARIDGSLARSPVARWFRSADTRLPFAALVVLAGVPGWLPGVTQFGFRVAVSLAVLVYGTAVVAAVLGTGRSDEPPVELWRRPAPAQMVLLVVVVLWALNPYLGFRTTGSFTMFSGLVTEGPASNHFFMPSIHLVDHQNDLVELIRSDDEDLQTLADQGQALPYFEVQRLSDDLQITLEGRREGQLVSITDANRTSVAPPNPVLRKLWLFRPVAADGAPICGN